MENHYLLSPEIQLVALSATIANSDRLTDWIDRVHGPTQLIYSDFRPVPLEFHFGNTKGYFPYWIKTQEKLIRDSNPKEVVAIRARVSKGPDQKLRV
jgi:superfamily II RNA helicase